MLKKILAFIIVLALSGCANNIKNDSEKINIVTTLFPQYDFARVIAGDKALVSLLLPLGTEPHSYEPSPKEIIDINNADLFIYTGKYMEPWAENIIKGIDKDKVTVLDISEGIELTKEGDKGHSHYGYDPHIWTSPVNAVKMVENILDALILSDSDNADYYKANAEKYIDELNELDENIRETVSGAERKKIIFGGRFAMHYFADEYGLYVKSAYDNCLHETEPGVKDILDIISEIKTDNIPVIYYEELKDPKIARSIAEETGIDMLLIHSCHNLSKDEWEKGESYLTLMNKNLENLKRGLI